MIIAKQKTTRGGEQQPKLCTQSTGARCAGGERKLFSWSCKWKMFFHFGSKAPKFSPWVKQGKQGEKDTVREASERDWRSLTMFLKVFPIPSTDTCIYLKQLCGLFLQIKSVLHWQIQNTYSIILDEMTALPMTAYSLISFLMCVLITFLWCMNTIPSSSISFGSWACKPETFPYTSAHVFSRVWFTYDFSFSSRRERLQVSPQFQTYRVHCPVDSDTSPFKSSRAFRKMLLKLARKDLPLKTGALFSSSYLVNIAAS